MNADIPSHLFQSGGVILEPNMQPLADQVDEQLDGLRETLGSLEEVAAGPKENIASRGPRNLPKPDARKARRQRVRAARRASRR